MYTYIYIYKYIYIYIYIYVVEDGGMTCVNAHVYTDLLRRT